MMKTLAVKIAAWRRYRESVRELSRLSDRELNDLGIGRADIQTIVRQAGNATLEAIAFLAIEAAVP